MRCSLCDIAVLLAVLSSNAHAAGDYNALSPEDQQAFHGTQPGDHRLSDYFSVEVDEALTRFFYWGRSKADKQLIGVIATKWIDRAKWGPREIAFAISQDGQRLLFFDEPEVARGQPTRMKYGVVVADLYQFDADDGSKTLIKGAVHRRGFHCVQLPRNYVRFGNVKRGFTLETIAYSTESDEISLDARRKRLHAAGRSAEVCGPLR